MTGGVRRARRPRSGTPPVPAPGPEPRCSLAGAGRTRPPPQTLSPGPPPAPPAPAPGPLNPAPLKTPASPRPPPPTPPPPTAGSIVRRGVCGSHDGDGGAEDARSSMACSILAARSGGQTAASPCRSNHEAAPSSSTAFVATTASQSATSHAGPSSSRMATSRSATSSAVACSSADRRHPTDPTAAWTRTWVATPTPSRTRITAPG